MSDAPEAALELLDEARQDEPEAVLRYLNSRSWVSHYDDPGYEDTAPEDCDRCDDDHEHQVGVAEYRCYTTFLGRLITTRKRVEV